MKKFSKIVLFSKLSSLEQQNLIKIAEKRTFKKDEKIFSKGELGDGFYIIKSGKVRISINIPGIGEELLTMFSENDHFGEMSTIDGNPRSANAIAATDVECLFFEKENFLEYLAGDKNLITRILWGFLNAISARLRGADQKLIDILFLMKSF